MLILALLANVKTNEYKMLRFPNKYYAHMPAGLKKSFVNNYIFQTVIRRMREKQRLETARKELEQKTVLLLESLTQ